MFMLTLKQKAALEVAKFVGWAVLCGFCTSYALTSGYGKLLFTIALGLLIVYGMIMMYEMFLARLEQEEKSK